jgi:regulatory protein
LAAKGHDRTEVDAALDELARRKLLSDERFAEQYVASRARKGYGPLRIRAELRERGVDPALVAACLDNGGHDWRGLLRAVRDGRFGIARPGDRREAARQARFLLQRGFPESLVRDLLFGD